MVFMLNDLIFKDKYYQLITLFVNQDAINVVHLTYVNHVTMGFIMTHF